MTGYENLRLVEEKQKLYLNVYKNKYKNKYQNRWRETKVVFKFYTVFSFGIYIIVEEKQKLYLNTTSKKVFLKIELVEEKQKLYLNKKTKRLKRWYG